MKIAFDSNVLVAALATRGLCADLMAACLQNHLIVVSDYVLAEVERAMVEKFKISQKDATAMITRLRLDVEIVEPKEVPAQACRDSSDLPVLGMAIAGECDCLVTGDADLKILKSYEAIKIVSPRELAERLRM